MTTSHVHRRIRRKGPAIGSDRGSGGLPESIVLSHRRTPSARIRRGYDDPGGTAEAVRNEDRPATRSPSISRATTISARGIRGSTTVM